MGDNGIVFEDHFFVLNFDARHGGGDLLIVNLISRKKFWIKKELLENQIKADAVENPPNYENPPNFNNFWYEKSKVCAIIVEKPYNRINMVYEIQFYRNGIEKILGSFEYWKCVSFYFYNNAPLFCAILKTLKDATLKLKLDDQNEITDYEVIEAELHRLE